MVSHIYVNIRKDPRLSVVNLLRRNQVIPPKPWIPNLSLRQAINIFSRNSPTSRSGSKRKVVDEIGVRDIAGINKDRNLIEHNKVSEMVNKIYARLAIPLVFLPPPKISYDTYFISSTVGL